jgi:hypothetical protein
MEEIQDLDVMIGAFHKTLDNEWKFIEVDDWSTKTDFKKKTESFNLHTLITEKIVRNAQSVLKLAISNGSQSSPRVKAVTGWAHKFFKIYAGRLDTYLGKQDYLQLMEEKPDIASLEMSFQSESSKKYFVLQSIIKDIGGTDTSRKVKVETFNNVPIPLIMRKVAEREFPEIVEYLKDRENNDSEQDSEA